jgi:hypothetical protein
MAEMGIDSLKGNLSNPARSYLWDVVIPVPIGGGESTTYQMRAMSAEIPSRSNDPITIPYKQTAGFVVAGKLKYTHEWSCEFREGEDKKVFDALRGWQQNIVNDAFGVGIGDPLYKTDIYITTLKTDGSIWMKLKLKGCWVSSVDAVTLSYADDGLITYKVKFAFDSWTEAA